MSFSLDQFFDKPVKDPIVEVTAYKYTCGCGHSTYLRAVKSWRCTWCGKKSSWKISIEVKSDII